MSQKKMPLRGRAARPPRQYEIRIRGAIGPTLLEAFPELDARRAGPDTVLSGSLADPSALYGVIHQIEALALELLEVRSPSATSYASDSHTRQMRRGLSSRAKGDPS